MKLSCASLSCEQRIDSTPGRSKIDRDGVTTTDHAPGCGAGVAMREVNVSPYQRGQ
jgi:hypothetical protein